MPSGLLLILYCSSYEKFSVPSGPPQLVQCSPTSPTSLSLSWQAKIIIIFDIVILVISILILIILTIINFRVIIIIA